MIWPEKDYSGVGGGDGGEAEDRAKLRKGICLLLQVPHLVGFRVQPCSSAQDNITEELARTFVISIQVENK